MKRIVLASTKTTPFPLFDAHVKTTPFYHSNIFLTRQTPCISHLFEIWVKMARLITKIYLLGLF